jgi:hypothetical protein
VIGVRDRYTSRVDIPQCHAGHVSRPSPGGGPSILTAVWICEYPYRTVRPQGPSADCGDCPVWRAMEQRRHANETEAEAGLAVAAAAF